MNNKKRKQILTRDKIKQPTELIINLKSGKIISVKKDDVYRLEDEINRFKHSFRSNITTFLIEFKDNNSTIELEFLISQVEGYSVEYKERG